MQDPLNLPHKQLADAMAEIQSILWHENGCEAPEKEWTAETIEEVALVLITNGLGPIDELTG